MTEERPEILEIRNGQKVELAFAATEYEERLAKLRTLMNAHDLPAILLTSMESIAYFSGFLYCSFGRSYGCVVTQDACMTISANIDGGQPWRRSHGGNLVYTDWKRHNFWRAVRKLSKGATRIGIEGEHLTIANQRLLLEFLDEPELVDVSKDLMAVRLIKSAAEIDLIRAGAQVADYGGAALRDAIRLGATEIEIATAGRNAMENEIARRFPNAEYRDTWVWFQSGINTDGAHNPPTKRSVQTGDILSLNTFPMISGYYTALERTLFLGEPDSASLRFWEANLRVMNLGLELIKPGAKCSDICVELNRLYDEEDLLSYRTFGYGHSFGLLSHYYGRETILELREDNDMILEPGMVVSMEPMICIPEGQTGAGGYREHDILVVTESGAENLTKFPMGPAANIIAA
ncbi:MAG: aminopeptidase P family protein [Aestuariivita sp.]|nr:aminopeptidase P family protein [Aestuariivita sp.]MCY4346018.1 aminopeptidase P family protein [Aestuariivita sp.]